MTFHVILNPNIQILGRCCLCMLFGPLLQFICQSRVGLDWNGLSAWYFFLYFHFHRWLGNCFEEGDTAAWRWKLKRCLPWNASDILASTKFDFWADKSRFLRQQILAFEGEIRADVDAGGSQLAHLSPHKHTIHERWHVPTAFPEILTRQILHFIIFLRKIRALNSLERSLTPLPFTSPFFNQGLGCLLELAISHFFTPTYTVGPLVNFLYIRRNVVEKFGTKLAT